MKNNQFSLISNLAAVYANLTPEKVEHHHRHELAYADINIKSYRLMVNHD